MIGCCLMLFFKSSFTKSFLSYLGLIPLALRIQPAVSFLIWGHSMCTFRLLTCIFLYSWLIKSTRLRNIAFTFFGGKKCIFNIRWVSISRDSQWQVLGSPGPYDVLLVPLSPGHPEEVVWSGSWVQTAFVTSTFVPLFPGCFSTFSNFSLLEALTPFLLSPRFNSIPLAPPHWPFLGSPKQGDTVGVGWSQQGCSPSGENGG